MTALRIGENAPRREDRALLTGETRFFADRGESGALALAFLRSPVAHGFIEQLDLAEARAVPGVRLVLTASDLLRNGPLPVIDLCEGSLAAPLPLLATDRVLHVGQAVAAIVADDSETARRARDAARLVIAPVRPLMDVESALAGAPLHGESNAVHTLRHRAGDPERAFAQCPLILEETFRFHRVAPTPMEPRGAEADYDPATGRLTLAATTQVPLALRDCVADLLGRDADSVSVERLPLGGGFGGKECVYAEEILAAAAALRLGARVRWRETRREHFAASSHAREGRARLRLAVERDGFVRAAEVDGVSDIGAGYAFVGNTPGAAMGGMVRGPYRIPDFAGRTRSVVTNKTPLNVYRGAGHPQAVFAMERMMDRAAQALGMDRIAIRRCNLIARDDFPFDRGVSYPGAGRIVYDSGDYAACLDEALAAIGAEGFDARRCAARIADPARRLGLGVAMMVELTATGPDESVALSVAEDGRVTVETAVVEIGQRAIAALTQVLSDATGLAPDVITIHAGGSAIAGSGGGTFASRGAAIAGAAVADAGERLKAAALALYAETTGLAADGLRWEDGGILAPGSNAPLSLADLCTRLDAPQRARLNVTGAFCVSAPSYASACHAAIVSVDVETGVVDVLDYAAAHDCGRVLNPQGVDDQIVGGVMQAIGATLFEEVAYAADGALLTQGLLDYPLPVAANVPRFHLRHVETPSPLNPLGMKGAGEAGFTGAPAALVSAIEDALAEFGVRLCDDGPYTPSRIRAVLRQSPRSTHSSKRRNP